MPRLKPFPHLARGFFFHPKALREHSRTRLKVKRGGKEPQKASLPGSASLIGKVRRGAMPPRSWRVALPPPRQGGSGSGRARTRLWGLQHPHLPAAGWGAPGSPHPNFPGARRCASLPGGSSAAGGGSRRSRQLRGRGGPPGGQPEPCSMPGSLLKLAPRLRSRLNPQRSFYPRA